MKKNIFIIAILIFQTSLAIAANSTISAIENNLFGYEYTNESDSKRIERIENFLYGTKKAGTLKKRIENIQNDIGYSKPELKEENNIQSSKQTQSKEELINVKEDTTVEYPIVDRMEEEIFKTNYKTENIYQRLERLETQVFSKTSNDALNDRVDKLASIILPKKNQRSQENYTKEELDKYYQNSGLEMINSQSLPFHLAVLEQDLLKGNYENENISRRLERLENKLFNRTFPSDNDITRLQRVMVAYDAKQKSYKYENNKRMQNMATASQIGGILLMILAMIL